MGPNDLVDRSPGVPLKEKIIDFWGDTLHAIYQIETKKEPGAELSGHGVGLFKRQGAYRKLFVAMLQELPAAMASPLSVGCHQACQPFTPPTKRKKNKY